MASMKISIVNMAFTSADLRTICSIIPRYIDVLIKANSN